MKLRFEILALLLLALLVTCCAGEDPGDDDATDDDDASGDDDDSGSDDDDAAPVTRKMLHEVFTGSTCGPCLEADANLHAVLAANEGRYTVVSYPIGSDPYITTEGVDRRMFYLPGESSYSIPFVHADGVNGFHPSDIEGGDEPYSQEYFDAFHAGDAQLSIALGHSVDGQTVTMDVTVTPRVDVPSEQLRLFLVVVEDFTYGNVGTNGQTEFHHVMKKMVPDDEGFALPPLVTGEPVELTEAYTFQGDYTDETGIYDPVDHDVEHTVEDFDNLSVVAFVQDVETWEVYQSAWTTD